MPRCIAFLETMRNDDTAHDVSVDYTTLTAKLARLTCLRGLTMESLTNLLSNFSLAHVCTNGHVRVWTCKV